MSGHRPVPADLPPGKKAGTYYTVGWVGPRASLNDCEKRKPSSLAGTQTSDITARSPVSIPTTVYPFHWWIVASRPKIRSLVRVSGLAYKYTANGQKYDRGGRDCWHMSCLCYRIVNNVCSLSKTAMAQGWTVCPSSLDTCNCKGVTLLILTLEVVFALVSLFCNSQYQIVAFWKRMPNIILNLYRSSFIILYNDQQMHNYLTNYHTPPTYVDTTVSSSGSS